MAQHTKRAIREGFLSLLNENSFDKITVLDIADRGVMTEDMDAYIEHMGCQQEGNIRRALTKG